MPPVEGLRVAPAEGPHPVGEVGGRRLEEELEGAPEEGVGVDEPAPLRRGPPELHEEALPVRVVAEEGAPLERPERDVVQRSREVDAGRSGHAPRL